MRAIWNEAGNQFAIAQRLLDTPDSGISQHLLSGAWSISVMGNETIQFTLTVEPNGTGMMRTPQGNAAASISCTERRCSISASNTYENRLVTIRLDAIVDALTLRSDSSKVADSMTGTADIDDGKRKGSFPFKATRLAQ